MTRTLSILYQLLLVWCVSVRNRLSRPRLALPMGLPEFGTIPAQSRLGGSAAALSLVAFPAL